MDKQTTEGLLQDAQRLRLVLEDASDRLAAFTKSLREILVLLDDEEEDQE